MQKNTDGQMFTFLILLLIVFFCFWAFSKQAHSGEKYISARPDKYFAMSPANVDVFAYILKPGKENTSITFVLSTDERGFEESSYEELQEDDELLIIRYEGLRSGTYKCEVYLTRQGEEKPIRATARFKVQKANGEF